MNLLKVHFIYLFTFCYTLKTHLGIGSEFLKPDICILGEGSPRGESADQLQNWNSERVRKGGPTPFQTTKGRQNNNFNRIFVNNFGVHCKSQV